MEKQSKMFLLLDSRGAPLGMGELIGELDTPQLQLEVQDDKISDVMEHESIQLIPMFESGPPIMGRVLRCRNDMVMVERLRVLDSEMRQNLRIPIHFQSFIYPMEGSWWRGRWDIESNDLSCGGIAFFSTHTLKLHERLEIVIPVTEQPVILRGEILRQRPTDREGVTMYAAKFIDLCYDEEMLVREAVFNIQLTGRARR